MENTNQEKQIKQALRNSVSPFLIGLRNELKNTNSLVASLLEATQKEFENFNLADLKGDDGYTPRLGVDYFTVKEKYEFLTKATPVKGVDYFTEKEVKEIIKASTPKRGVDYFTPADVKAILKKATPKKGVHYFTDSEIEKILKKITPKKGKDYVDGKDGITKTVIVKDETKIPAETVRDLLESLRGSSRLSMKAIKGLEDTIKRLEIAIANKSGGSSIGGSGGGGSSTPVDLSSYVQFTGSKTEGSIPFYNSNGVLAEDNQNNFWDNVLKRNIISSTLGSELLTNGTFTGNATGWSLGSGWAYSSNSVSHTSNGTSGMQPSTALTTVLAGYVYRYSITISNLTVGSVTLSVGGVTITAFSANGTYTGKFLATSNANLLLVPTNTARLTVDDISLKRLSGGSVATGNVISSTFNSVQGALGTTTSAGYIADNPSDATASVMQASPSYLRRGRGWLSNSSVSFPFEVQDYSVGKVSTTAYGSWLMQHRANNGSWTEFIRFDSDPTGEGFSITSPSISNGSPDATRNFTINNSGSFSWIDFKFSGTVKSNIGAGSSGELKFYAQGGSYFEYYNKSGGSLFSYNYPQAFVHGGYGNFGSGVNAGSQNSPTSTLQSQGGLALRVKRANTNVTLDNTATHWLLDASTAQSCEGTPSNSCASHGDQSSCEANNSHGGCYWNAGNSCSVYSYEYGMSSCSGTTGCSADTTSCSGFGDESSCTGANSSYGGSCSWSYGTDCSGLDEYTCGITSGCSVNTISNDCSSFNGNESSCGGTSGCSISSSNTCPSQSDEGSCWGAGCYWDGSSCSGDNSTCSGSYPSYTGCSGIYGAGCSGNYYTGNCSGVYGAGCLGTPSCAGVSYANCTSEAGCSQVSTLNANLPDGETCPDRTYFIANDSSGGADVRLLPYSGQTIDDTSSLTLSAYKDWVHIAYFKKTADCSTLNESSCNSTTGCTSAYTECSSYGDSESCTAGGCSWDGMSCSGSSVFNYCYGTYVVAKNWYVFGR